MRSLHKNHFIILYLFSIFVFISCSKDSEDPSETEITVTTSDFSITMDENPMNGQVIGTVSATTNEGSVSFSITEQNPSGAFSIDASSGELKVADETLFDFETNPTITGTIKVSNGAISENALVTITLNDLVEDNIYEGNVILRSQNEVNIFGANNYTQINGYLVIGKLENEGYSDITDLTPLLSLEHIGEYFYIQYNGALTTTSGIDNISYLGNGFALLYNPLIVNLVDLNNIENIPGSFTIYDNPSLTNLDGMQNISTVGENFYVGKNDVMPNLDWLSSLTSVGGSLHLVTNTLIRNMTGMSNLISIGGTLYIEDNNSLHDLSGFQNLTGTITNLFIGNNHSLININGIANISITGGLHIYNNSLLENLNALLNTTSLNSVIEIINNDKLIDLYGLSNLTSNGGYEITIRGNENLGTLNGLGILINSGSLRITQNINLTDFCDLQNLFINGNNPSYIAFSNAYNPTKQDIIDGNCSL